MSGYERDSISLDRDRVVRHDAPDGMKLALMDWSSGVHKEYAAAVNLNGAEYRLATWNSEERAKVEFGALKQLVESGNYTLHIYEGGRIEIKADSE